MAPLTDSIRLAAYKNALANWPITGYVQFELSESAFRWIKQELDGISTREIARLMHEYVDSGGEIDEQPEKRPEWSDQYAFHHDLRLSVQGNAVYIETRLHWCIPFVPDEPWILVVNVHAP